MTSSNSGQIGLVVLLIMATMLTVGVGAVSRSTNDLKITRQEVIASEVFNAAEAGIEAGLSDIDSGTYTGGSYSNTLTIGDQEDPINVEYNIQEVRAIDSIVAENQGVTVDVRGGAGQRLQLSWSSNQVSCPAVIVKVYNGGSTASVWTEGYSGCSSSGRNDDFVNISSASIQIDIDPDDEYVRIRPVYGQTQIVAQPIGGWTMPVQYHTIVSRASNPNTQETKVIELNRGNDALPSIFDYAVFSGNALVM